MKTRALSTLWVTASLLVSSGCGGRLVLAPSENKVRTEVLEVSATWIKDKGDKFDIELRVLNTSERSVIVMLGDMTCSRGESTGILRHTFFNTGERTIDLSAGQSKTFGLVCQLDTKSEGAYQIKVSRVFENPTNDGKTKGKVIAKDIVWTHKSDR